MTYLFTSLKGIPRNALDGSKDTQMLMPLIHIDKMPFGNLKPIYTIKHRGHEGD